MTKRKPTTKATPAESRQLKAAGWVEGPHGLYWKQPGPRGGYYSPRGALAILRAEGMRRGGGGETR